MYREIMHNTSEIILQAKRAGDPSSQPKELRSMLQLLTHFRWRREAGASPVTLVLQGWALTSALVRELSALPRFEFDFSASCRLCFMYCDWSVVDCGCELLGACVPARYTHWTVAYTDAQQMPTAEHFKALCTGTRARGAGCEKLTLRVDAESMPYEAHESTRSQVEAWVDEQGLGAYMKPIDWLERVDWDYS